MAPMSSTIEEDLRYLSSIGDEEGVRGLINKNVDINSGNSMNGWTALHWASYRGHGKIVEILLQNGAKRDTTNFNGETPANLTNDKAIHKLLGEKTDVVIKIPELPIIPSYIKYPPIPVSNISRKSEEISGALEKCSNDNCLNKIDTNDLILKVRIANSKDPDFIEIELSNKELTVEKLIDICCDELEISKKEISKIRKLPNTIIRKDKDVQRLKDYQEIEIVLFE